MTQIPRRLFLALSSAALAPAQAPKRDARNAAPPGTRTVFGLREWAAQADWERHAARLRRRILFAAGLWPMPRKSLLMTRSHGRANHGAFVTENVLAETWPGLWMAANLYLPARRTGRVPGVLVAHGHWKNGRLEDTDECSTPRLCANLAAQGFAALAYDMAGYNESDQLPHSFGQTAEEQSWNYGPLGVQLWNSIRMLDYLASREEVDSGRIGMTGASGGGTQTFLLAAIDERVKAMAPVNMISAHFQGGCDCENAPGLRWGTNNVEFASLAAPRPQFLVAATGDWTRDLPRIEFPAVRKVYGLYGAGDRIACWQQDAGHNYNLASREAVYAFFHRLWGAPGTPPPRETAPPPPMEALRVNRAERPDSALTAAQFFVQWRQRCEAATKTLDRAQKRARMAAVFGLDAPLGPVAAEGSGDGMTLTTPGGARIPARLLREGGSGKVLLLNAGDSAAAASARPAATVLAIDLFQTGAARDTRPRGERHFLTFNAADVVCQVQDVLAAAEWLAARPGGGPVEVLSGGDAVLPVTPGAEALRRTEQRCVALQLERLLAYPLVARGVDAGELFLHGWHYVIEDGEVWLLDVESGEFRRADGPRGDAGTAPVVDLLQ